MRLQRTLSAIAVTALPLTLVAVGASTPAQAGNSVASSSTPTWWQKFETVSAPGFKPAGARQGGAVKVGSNVDVSNENTPQSETSIAINPANPAQLMAGSNEIVRLPMRGYFSSDSGKSWGGVDLPLPPPISTNGFDFGSDPGVAWDLNGNVYYSYVVVFFSASGSLSGSEMAVARSGDGGRTWTPTFFALGHPGQFNDKPMITVDTNPASPHRNTVYVAWDTTPPGNGGPSSSGVLFSRSADGGRTFSTPTIISATGSGQHFGIGADPFVGPDGHLYVAWHDLSKAILVRGSTDGGNTWGAINTVAATVIPIEALIPPQNSRAALVYPACGGDRSGGSFRGRLYCSWTDQNASGDTDIYVATSTDQGATWSAPLTVNDDRGGAFQFNQWLAVDPTSGAVDLSWDDSRSDPSNHATDVFFAQSVNGGAAVSTNVRVTTATTDETASGADLGNQYGDYAGIDAFGGVAHPVWVDRRSSLAPALGEEVFTAAVTTK
jgi:hypothetical protein